MKAFLGQVLAKAFMEKNLKAYKEMTLIVFLDVIESLMG